MGGVTMGATLVVITALATVGDSQSCTSACDTQLSAVSVGLLFGLLVVVAWSPYAGAVLAIAFVVVIAVDDAQNTVTNWPTWIYALEAGLVVVCVAGLYAPRGTAATAEWLAAAVHSRLAPSAEPRAAADPWRAVGWLLIVGGVVAGAWMWSRRFGEDDVLGWWLVLSAFSGAVGVGIVTYRWAADRSRQFDRDLPVSDVLVQQWWSDVDIYPAGSGPADSAVLTYQYADGDPPRADQDLRVIGPAGLVPAQLYGVPAEGWWGVAVVNGVALTPAGPLRRAAHVAPEDENEDDIEDEAEDEESTEDGGDFVPFFRLEPEEIDRIDPADRDADPRDVRLHRQQPIWAYLVMSVLLVLIATQLPRMSLVPTLVVAAVVQAGLCWLGWWTILRPRIAWNGAGLAAVDHRRSVRVRWQDVLLIVAGFREVRILIGSIRLSVPNADVFGRLRWGVPGTGRSTDELALALEYARQRNYDRRDELAAIEPPRLDSTRPPLLLYAFWLAGTLALVATLTA
jgi:hypothetical protein